MLGSSEIKPTRVHPRSRGAAIYMDTKSGYLIFVADGIGPMKAALEFAPTTEPNTPNTIVGAFRVSAMDVAGAVKGGQWQVLK